MPVRQSQKEAGRNPVLKQPVRSKHIANNQRVKIDISKPSRRNPETKVKKASKNIKAKKLSLPMNAVSQGLCKTKMIKLDINSKDLRIIEGSNERRCETTNNSVERTKSFKGMIMTKLC